MSDAALRELERRVAQGDEAASLRLFQEQRRRGIRHPLSLLVGPCGRQRKPELHILDDRRTAGELGGPRWGALCHRHGRRRWLELSEGHEPMWLLLRRVFDSASAAIAALARIPAEEGAPRLHVCKNCFPAAGDSFDRLRARQLVALGITAKPPGQRGLFEEAS